MWDSLSFIFLKVILNFNPGVILLSLLRKIVTASDGCEFLKESDKSERNENV